MHVHLFQMWPGLIQKAKDGGLDVIETYVFWNLHESIRGQVDIQSFYIIYRSWVERRKITITNDLDSLIGQEIRFVCTIM